MAKNKKSKSLLNEATVRRMMRLADIPELSESFFSEDSKAHEYSREEEDGVEKRAGEDKDGHYKDYMGPEGGNKGDDSKTDPGHKDYMKEESEEESELRATEDELGKEDHEADEEADELDAEASEGDAEITPEAAQAIVDLAAQLEASGALEDAGAGEEVEAEIEMSDDGGEMEEEEIEELDEALAKLGIEVVDDKKLQETVRKRVIARLLKEKKEHQRAKQIDRLADRIFARLKGK